MSVAYCFLYEKWIARHVKKTHIKIESNKHEQTQKGMHVSTDPIQNQG